MLCGFKGGDEQVLTGDEQAVLALLEVVFTDFADLSLIVFSLTDEEATTAVLAVIFSSSVTVFSFCM